MAPLVLPLCHWVTAYFIMQERQSEVSRYHRLLSACQLTKGSQQIPSTIIQLQHFHRRVQQDLSADKLV